MSRLRDQLVPVLAGALVVVVAIAVVLLLKSASDQGTNALRAAKLAQVDATADSFNQRVKSGLTAVQGLGATPWQLTVGNTHDQRTLDSYNIDPAAQAGFFLINDRDIITDGVLLRPGRLGTKFTAPGWADARRKLATDTTAVLPVSSHSYTTELPTYDLIVPILDANSHRLRGAIVFETAVTPQSAFEREIRQLAGGDPSTAEWLFLDNHGTVVASTGDTGLGRPVGDKTYLTHETGLTTIGPRLVIIAAVPVLGWRVVFREDEAQFDSALSDPLQRAGLILVLLLLAIGLTFVVVLIRRLREAREQERRLRELTRSQAEFISVVSHELRTPVAGVLGFLQTTVDHWDSLTDAERLTTVRRAVTNARRLQAMTRDVLDTESIEAGQFGYSFQPVDLHAELLTAIEAAQAADPTHLITLHEPDRLIRVAADADRLQQVLSNLLDNARRNTPAHEPIVVDTELLTGDQPRVRVSVIDRGPGVAPDQVERIFEKFVRGSDSAVSGTGLGLYIVRKIIEAHGGRIWCESAPGVRTAFVFELPLTGTTAETGNSTELEPSG